MRLMALNVNLFLRYFLTTVGTACRPPFKGFPAAGSPNFFFYCSPVWFLRFARSEKKNEFIELRKPYKSVGLITVGVKQNNIEEHYMYPSAAGLVIIWVIPL